MKPQTSAWLQARARGIAAGCATALAFATAATRAEEAAQTKEKEPAREAFSRFEDSFVIVNRMQNTGWTQDDDLAIRARLSFKFSFCGPQLGPEGTVTAAPTPGQRNTAGLCRLLHLPPSAELFGAYTGEFDFYYRTRESSPVVNRTSAPGFFVRLPATVIPSLVGTGWKESDGLEIGLQHRSDGQVVDVTGPRGQEIAREQYAARNWRYFDTVSHGANYLSLALNRAGLPGWPQLSMRTKLRLYVGGQESDVTWGPLAGKSSRFSDYDRLQTKLSWQFNGQNVMDLEWRLGDRGLGTSAWTLGYEWTVLDGVPVYFRLHRGPMNTLSNYTQRQDSFGVGLRLARY